jgi:hypothetical protein
MKAQGVRIVLHLTKLEVLSSAEVACVVNLSVLFAGILDEQQIQGGAELDR